MEQLAEAMRNARRTVLTPDDPQGPAAKSPGAELPSHAGAREPGDEDPSARVAPRDHGGVMERTADEAAEHRSDVATPLGFYWARGADGNLQLKPQTWFVSQLAKYADDIFANMRQKLSIDPDVQDDVRELAELYDQYGAIRHKYNQMAPERKLRNEMDDACYQLCQAAKYYVDATERAQTQVNSGRDISDDQRIQTLSDLSVSSATEGYVIAAAVFKASNNAPKMNFQAAAWRVANYSARRLTEWFAERERVNLERTNTNNSAALAVLTELFGRKS